MLMAPIGVFALIAQTINKVAGNNASPNNINQTNNNTPAAGTNNGGVPVQEDYY